MLQRCFRFVLLLVAALAASPAAAQSPRRGPAPGTLMAVDPVRETPPGVQAWRITYRSTAEDGASIQLTGMVIAPREAIPAKPRRVIAWAHGSWGAVDACTVSRKPAFFTASPALAEMVGQGYVVVAADYPGFGSLMTHGYLVGKETAWSVIDAVRAAQEIPAAAAGRQFAVWGESQGGHAALWVAGEARSYAPELTLVGTAAAAPPTDLVANLRQGSDANVRALLTTFVAYSWSRRFDAPLSTLFNRVNQGVATRLAENNCIELAKKPRLGTILGVMSVKQALKTKDIGAIQPWARIARANSVSPAQMNGPLLIAQSSKDVVVAPAVTRAFAQRYCRMGRPLRWVPIPNGAHEHSARDSAGPTLAWIAARFSGETLPNDCGKI
jgi:pimeloyl-ACP methyl ester carboxylesterase